MNLDAFFSVLDFISMELGAADIRAQLSAHVSVATTAIENLGSLSMVLRAAVPLADVGKLKQEMSEKGQIAQ